MTARQRRVPVRIPEDVAERVQAEADARGISRDWMAGRLIAEALERLVPAEEFSLTRHRPKLPPGGPERPNPTIVRR